MLASEGVWSDAAATRSCVTPHDESVRGSDAARAGGARVEVSKIHRSPATRKGTTGDEDVDETCYDDIFV
jgi:hypothetical protein